MSAGMALSWESGTEGMAEAANAGASCTRAPAFRLSISVISSSQEGEKWLRPESRSAGIMMFYKSARVEYHPVGVVGAIVPWNYPFHNVFNPLTAAVMAGNSIVIKVSLGLESLRRRSSLSLAACHPLDARSIAHLH